MSMNRNLLSNPSPYGWGNLLSTYGNPSASATATGNSGFPYREAMAGAGIGNLLYGLFGDAGSPYEDASKYLEKYLPEVQKYQKPFYEAGTSAIPEYQKWLQGMRDPSRFINNLMVKYQESPYAQNLQRQARQGGINAASASGLVGSTPFAQQMAQTAGNISSADMNQWLQNVLGINTQYGAGQAGMVGMGQNSANALTDLFNQYMQNQAALQYGQGQASEGQTGSLFSGLGQLAGLFL